MRVVIGGGPRTGKTTLAAKCYPPELVHHTDDLINLGWSEASAAAAEWMAEPGPWVIEGVAAVRALRKALDASPEAPCDQLYWLTEPHEALAKGQASMAKGCDTVLAGIRDELIRRGVQIITGAEVFGEPSD